MIKTLCKKVKGNKGFTLIELIIVIAILAVLALILIPRFGGFRERARNASNEATARTIETAIVTLLADESLKLAGSGDGSFEIGSETTEEDVVELTVSDVENLTPDDEEEVKDLLVPLLGTDVKHTDGGVFKVTIYESTLAVEVTPDP